MFNLQSKKIMFVYLAAAAMIFCAINVLADWDYGSPHKMHFPQLPDPVGWDVNVSDYTLADDFLCTGDGSVKQVHFWISWENDIEGIIDNIRLSFHKDIPAADSPTGYSMPGELLWEHNFVESDFKYRFWDIGDQGWFDPVTGIARKPDHQNIYQINVTLHVTHPFVQVLDTIYWLDIKLDVFGGLAGWKTSIDHWNDDAVFELVDDPFWGELRDPYEPEISLDLAFVIDPIPEPGFIFIGIAAIFLLKRVM